MFLGSVLGDAVEDTGAFDQLVNLFTAIEATPAFFASSAELEHHGESGEPTAGSFGLTSAVADRGETGLDWVGGPKISPVFA